MYKFENKVKESQQILVEALKQQMTQLPVSDSEVHPLNTIYYIEKGKILILNKGRVFTLLSAPDFIGIHCILGQPKTHLTLEFTLFPDTIAYKVDAMEAKEVIAKKNLYKSVSYLVANRLHEYSFLAGILTNPQTNAYKKVKIAINTFYDFNDVLESRMSLSSFVIDSTGLSKSRVMYILSQLRKGGHLSLEEGRMPDKLRLPNEF